MRSIVTWLVIAGAGAVAHAAPCDSGFLLKQGAIIETTRFNAAHQPTGRLVSTLVSATVAGDHVTAVETVDNFVGATRTSRNTVDLICDGKTVSITVRNDEGMREAVAKGVESTGGKLMGSMNLSQPQVYPLTLKVGDELPPFRAYNMMIVKRPPPDWGGIAASHDWTKLLFYAITNKMATGSQLVTMAIKVVGQESCAIPGGANVACWRITKQMFSKLVDGAADMERDVKEMAKGAVMTPITEWFAPGIGVVKLEIGPPGHPIVSMALTGLKLPPEPVAPAAVTPAPTGPAAAPPAAAPPAAAPPAAAAPPG